MSTIVRWILVVAVVGVLVFVAGSFWPTPHTKHATASDPTACQSRSDQWVRGLDECLFFHAYPSATPGTHPDLVVVLHGDAPFVNPSYQYAAARMIRQSTDSVIAIGLLRPGYTDGDGHRSSGTRGRTTGDNYTPEVIDAIATAVDSLKQAYHPAHVVMVGHSGGAAITADIIGRHPHLVNGAVLVSCPCDLAAFRHHMFAKQLTPIWLAPVSSLSPIELADSVDTGTVVRVIVGESDDLAPPPYSEAYAARLKARGVPVTLVEIPNAPHDILLEAPVIREIATTIAVVRARH